MKRNKWVTTKNWLTHHALACGYIECTTGERTDGVESMRLWHEGGPCYHVRANDADNRRLFWESFESLPDARKFFAQKCRELKIKRVQPNFKNYAG